MARSVERRASPAVVSVMKDFSQPPTSVGLENGKGPHREHQADEEEDEEIGPLAPAHERRRHQGEHRHRVGGRQLDDVLGVADRRVGPRAGVVGAVEVPVAEAADDVGRVGGGRGRGDRLGELEDVDAVGRLHLEAGDPPQARPQGQDADAQPGAQRVPPGRLAQDHHGVEEPEDGRDADVDDGAGVDAAHQRHHDREEGRFAPPAAAQGHDGQAQHEGQAGPGQQDHRDAPGVLEEVRREHVGQGGRGRPGAAQPEDAARGRGRRARRRRGWSRARGVGRPRPARRAGGRPRRTVPSAAGSRCTRGVTVPRPTVGFHMNATWLRKRVGSRYR